MRFFHLPLIGMLAVSGAVYAPITLADEHHHAVEYNMVSLASTASKYVSNDQMVARLSIEKRHKQPQELAKQVNELMNFASDLAKKYPTVKFKTGQQTTYPIYDETHRQKLKEWRANSHIELSSQDFAATSKFIAELQQHFQLEHLNFSVSDQQRKQAEDELLLEVSKNFQARAALIAQSWHKSGYELVTFNVELQHHQYAPMAMSSSLRMAKVESDHLIPSQELNAGETKLTLSAHGSVQLK